MPESDRENKPDIVDHLMLQANLPAPRPERHFNIDKADDLERLENYLEDMETTPPFPCPCLRVLPEDLVIHVVEHKDRYLQGTLYCTELKNYCRIRGKAMKLQAGEGGTPRVGLECAAGHQLVASIESFLPVRQADHIYRREGYRFNT
jgi:hypothetical protein